MVTSFVCFKVAVCVVDDISWCFALTALVSLQFYYDVSLH